MICSQFVLTSFLPDNDTIFSMGKKSRTCHLQGLIILALNLFCQTKNTKQRSFSMHKNNFQFHGKDANLTHFPASAASHLSCSPRLPISSISPQPSPRSLQFPRTSVSDLVWFISHKTVSLQSVVVKKIPSPFSKYKSRPHFVSI